MNAADSQLAEQICQVLVEKKLIQTAEAQQIKPKIARGEMSVADWTTLIRAGITNEGNTDVSSKT